jgi:membrane fusion protein, epimerase transport system
MLGGKKKAMEHLPGSKPVAEGTRDLSDTLRRMADLTEPATGPQPLARINIIKVPADQVAHSSSLTTIPQRSSAPALSLPSSQPSQPTQSQQPSLPAQASAGLDDSGRRAIFLGVGIMVFFFGVLGTWAALAPLKGATTAQGVLVVEGSRKAIQHLEGGVVRDILVHEGDKVKAGQILVELDDNVPRTNVAVLSQQYDSYRAMVARLSAEFERASAITFPADLLARMDDPMVAETVGGQRKLFVARKAAFEAQISGMYKRISELQEQIVGSRAQNQSRRDQHRSVKGELDSLKPLLEKGIVTRARTLELDRSLQRLEGEEQEFASKVSLDQQAIEQMKRQITQTESERITSTVADLRDTQNRAAEAMQRLQSAREMLRMTHITSPVDGSVMGLNVFTQGAVIGRGEKIMEIVPDEKNLLIDAAIKIDDIIYVHVGMQAEIRLTAFHQRNVPVVEGTVTYISADRVPEAHTFTPQYPIKIRINEDALKDHPEIVLYPGMAVTVYVPTGDRTALEYLFAPLSDSLSTAFREH